MSFDDAKTTCQNMDAHLVEIQDQAEMEAVADLVFTSHLLIPIVYMTLIIDSK